MVQETDVRTARKKLGLSQEKLAEKLGVSRNTISRWEKGEVSPSAENLMALNRLFAQLEEPAPAKAEPAPPPDTPAKGKRLPFALACLGIVCALLIGIAALMGIYSIKQELAPDNVVPAEKIEGKEVDAPENNHIDFEMP